MVYITFFAVKFYDIIIPTKERSGKNEGRSSN